MVIRDLIKVDCKHMFKKGQSGNPGGRPHRGNAFYKLLDEVGIPEAIQHCISVLQGNHRMMASIHESADYIRLQNDAAKILMSKAPERIEGTSEDGAIVIKWQK